MITTSGASHLILRELRGQIGLSQRKIAKIAATDIGYISQASISLMEAGKAPVDARYESWLRVRAGERVVSVPPCPDCGSVHHARCNGNSGPVVVLAATERVVKAGGGRKRRKLVRPVATETQNSRRIALGAGWREIIEAGLSALEGREG